MILSVEGVSGGFAGFTLGTDGAFLVLAVLRRTLRKNIVLVDAGVVTGLHRESG